ncbi:hypothetical protein BDW74DRAFT_182481 [Aspergillus multicolor]|uniref:uncharacterized protein n=1 Tax=Aspergillus multicolor TaxID=41759 RepID=UPI003CCCD999
MAEPRNDSAVQLPGTGTGTGSPENTPAEHAADDNETVAVMEVSPLQSELELALAPSYLGSLERSMAEISTHDLELELLPSGSNSNSNENENEASHLQEQTTGIPVPDKGLERYHWPQPQGLQRNLKSEAFSTGLEVFLACCTLSFLVLAGFVIHLDGKEVSDYGGRIVEATKVSPTVFPIVFAAIAGSMMRSWALWRAENSASLGVNIPALPNFLIVGPGLTFAYYQLLEQLNGSTSFAGTLASILALRRPGLVTIPIVFLWAMSPLGGQSGLRMVSETTTAVAGNLTVGYMDMNISSNFAGSSSTQDTVAAVNSIYTASLLSSDEVKSSPRDVWGWPKMPLMRALPADLSTNGTNPWRATHQDDNLTYSSLYLDFDCHTLVLNVDDSDAYQTMAGDGKLLNHNASNLYNNTQYLRSPLEQPHSSFFMDTNFNFTAPSRNTSAMTLFYGSRDKTNGESFNATALYTCTVSTIFIESTISCPNAVCAVTRMRRSEKDKRPSRLTPWTDFWQLNDYDWVSLFFLLSQFPYAAGALDRFQASPTDSYIYNASVLYDLYYTRDWSTVPEQLVSDRLTTLFNTYYQATLAPFTISRASIADSVNDSTESDYRVPPFNTTTASTSRMITIYKIDPMWLSFFILTTAVLFLCAVTGLYIKGKTLAPDILGHVSSLTRDNPYIPLPRGGSSLSGLDRARLLHDLPVRLVGVGGDGTGTGAGRGNAGGGSREYIAFVSGGAGVFWREGIG